MIPVTLDRYLDPNLSRNKVDIETTPGAHVRSVQLPYIRAMAFSQVVLLLDTPFPRKLLSPVTSTSKLKSDRK